MMDQHFFNPEEFWGEWIMPSIACNHPVYTDQDYWRGRIWAPMNFLVYLGIRKYNLKRARTAIVEKSKALLLKEWRTHRHVHENYCADTGEGCNELPRRKRTGYPLAELIISPQSGGVLNPKRNKENSDRFYHWGGLLGLITLLGLE